MRTFICAARTKLRKYTPALAVALLVGGLGAGLLLTSHAATPTASIEAESGTVSSAASKVTDSTAHGSSAVKFSPAPGGGGGSGTGADRCPAYPAFPNASCTGIQPGITLTPSGSITVKTAGTVIQNLDITGTVYVEAANVVINNCRISSNDVDDINVVSGSLLVENTELVNATAEAMEGSNWTGYNLNVHGMFQDGFKGGNNVMMVGSWLHDFTPTPTAHADGIQIQEGNTNITLRHNYIDSPTDSAVFFKNDFGPNSAGPFVVDENELGGGGYTMYINDGNEGTAWTFSGFTVTDNVFLPDATYGPFTTNEPRSAVTTWSGNTYKGQPLNH